MQQDFSKVIAPAVGDALSQTEAVGTKRKESSGRSKGKEKGSKRKRTIDVDEAPPDFQGDDDIGSIHSQPDANEDPIARRNLILKINAWRVAFPRFLDEMLKDKDLEGMTFSELESLLKECKHVVGTRNAGDMAEWVPMVGLTLTEDLLLKCTPLRVQGLVNLSRDPQFKMTCKEVMLDFTTLSYVDPVYRLGFMVLNTVYMLDSENRREEMIRNVETSQNAGMVNEISASGQPLTVDQQAFLSSLDAPAPTRN
jgi:hypothetical protein